MTEAARWRRRLTTGVIVAGLVAVGALQLAGWRAVPVLSGSMTPYAAVGALVVTAPVAPADLAVGDVVAFAPPALYARGRHPVLHRVTSLEQVGGSLAMTTRGDANPEADPWRIDLTGAQVSRALVVLPRAGWLLMGGPLPAVALLLGATALVHGAAAVRRRRCPCTPAGRRGRHVLGRPVPAAGPATAPAPPTLDVRSVEPARVRLPAPRRPHAEELSPRSPDRRRR
ncbi:signal peptidase I [Quadrisphaera sp. KR29]|uniref:signal peptidase I n=1 Tax=Quadrisphaera sp. KR29 TaxID=3461391 RepID=UPI004043D4EE